MNIKSSKTIKQNHQSKEYIISQTIKLNTKTSHLKGLKYHDTMTVEIIENIMKNNKEHN